MNTKKVFQYIRGFLIGLIILICVGILYSLLYPFLLSLNPPPEELIVDAQSPYPVIGLKLIEWDIASDNVKSKVEDQTKSLPLSSEQRAVIDKFGIPLVAITIDYVYFPTLSNSNSVGRKICIQEIIIKGAIGDKEDFGLFHGDQNLLGGDYGQVCFQSSFSYVVNDTVAILPMPLGNRNFSNYLFPFDDRSIVFSLLFKGYYEREDGSKEDIDNVTVNVSFPHSRWTERTTYQEIQDETYFAKGLSITLKRLWFYRTLFFIIPVIAVVAVVSLVAVENTGSFWEVSISMLGLWSVREILTPSYITSPTIVDPILTLLYILLLIVVIMTLITKIKQRNAIDLALQIPIKRGVATLVKWSEDNIDRGRVSSEEISKAFFIRAEFENSASVKQKLKTVAEVFLKRPDDD